MTRVSDEHDYHSLPLKIVETGRYVRQDEYARLVAAESELQTLRAALTALRDKWRKEASFYEKKQVASKTKRDSEYWQVCNVLTLDQANELDAILAQTGGES